MSGSIRFILNETEVEVRDFGPADTLLDYLRLERRLRGTKEGCAEGDCGACTVLVGRLTGGALVYEGVNACIRFLGSLNATHIVTVEHLAGKDGALHPVQQAMVDCHGSQCGFCTPGFVMSLYGLWLANPQPTREEIERALQGNLCRCTGYEAIVKAAEQAALSRPSAADPVFGGREKVAARLKELAVDETIVIERNGERAILPASASDLARILAQEAGATIVAGSTDTGLWVTKQMRSLSPAVFINHLPELQTLDVTEDGMRIGAGVTYAAAFNAVSAMFPAFGRLISRIGGQQVRNMGTIGGNIANGSPIGDTPPALIALGAELTLNGAAGPRTLPLEAFFIDYGKQDRKPGEFVESVFIPRPARDSRYAVYKISKRRDEDISAVCGGFYLELEAGTVKAVRIAFGGMAGTPKRAGAVEAALLGRPWTEETVRAAQPAFDADYQPLTDWRATAGYRQLTAKNLLYRFFLETSGTPQELKRYAEA
ncbi:xanthine dehydrogenase small subunit [Rhizobiaceae bacterium BDR2-2]|uniref:Xanthine dehydrogenase small subunit n=1 Tax=Ectorhizobium quercum TaxID=2965071 RepID=A0AAE3MYF7_9HYPH|nr:xanthine dehydrogenase small subunit [Ectorhizobium quercum]MCX8996642.1 xanthine dehydrogenase small subunit [Ectorhizobium quercum]